MGALEIKAKLSVHIGAFFCTAVCEIILERTAYQLLESSASSS